jgi:hypothetical protein
LQTEEPLSEIEHALQAAEARRASGDVIGALAILDRLKSLRKPISGLDEARAGCALSLGDFNSAREMAKEALRWFPDSDSAKRIIETCRAHIQEPQSRSSDPMIERVRDATMLGPDRLGALRRGVREISGSIPGCVVECGVAGGGSLALLAAALAELGDSRELHGFDTFSGMPTPNARDRAYGVGAELTHWGTGTCSAPERYVRQLLDSLGVGARVTLHPGDFRDTLAPFAAALREPIALLHADGDWYESTKCIFECLWDRLAPGAVVQIDDYGHWEGCRAAVDEFFASRGLRLSLERIDATGHRLRKPV